ncbi:MULTISPECIES: threonine-phosphate decarboxylase CobD [unclassified Streptococcus]|uniref:threonine-phosphate decarboxylase CobD n=1 Tax=unclassified Streptococcus TaxID=2608887 RepID=UPI001D16D584|nr:MULTISPECIES: threonine-phosphate decarboxylase CobD [unclassified Streptococcus]
MMKVEHGGNRLYQAQKWGVDLQTCIDFSANINPLGISPRVRECLIQNLDYLIHYPDPDYQLARQAVATYHNLSTEQVLLGNGAIELIYQLARCLKPKTVVLPSPTFMEYEQAFREVSSDINYIELRPPHFEYQLDSLMANLAHLDSGDAFILCNPNNPTSSLMKKVDLLVLAEECTRKGVYLLLDEAFMDFLEDVESLIPELARFSQLFIWRSLTKFYAIPGLRLGYLVSSHQKMMKLLRDTQIPWMVNTLALSILPVLLEDESYRQKTLEYIARERSFLTSSLQEFSELTVGSAHANYIFIHYHGKLDLEAELGKLGIFIRSCQNYHGLDGSYYRLAVRRHEENQVLLATLKSLLGKEGS